MNSIDSPAAVPRRLFFIDPVPGFEESLESSPWSTFDSKHDKEVAEILVSRGFANGEWLEIYDPTVVITLARNASSASAAESILRGEIAKNGLEPDRFQGFYGTSDRHWPHNGRISRDLDSVFTVPDASLPEKAWRMPFPMIDYYPDVPTSLQAYRWASLYGANWQKQIYALGFAPIYLEAHWLLLCSSRPEEWGGFDIESFLLC